MTLTKTSVWSQNRGAIGTSTFNYTYPSSTNAHSLNEKLPMGVKNTNRLLFAVFVARAEVVVAQWHQLGQVLLLRVALAHRKTSGIENFFATKDQKKFGCFSIPRFSNEKQKWWDAIWPHRYFPNCLKGKLKCLGCSYKCLFEFNRLELNLLFTGYFHSYTAKL